MNKHWPQQEVFAARVKQFCKQNNLTTPRGAIRWEAAAEVFNISEVTLRQYMQYKARGRPRIDSLKNIANVIGCSVAEFLDDPGDAPPGMAGKWAALSERERAIASEMLADIALEELSLIEKEELYRLFQEGKYRMIRMRQYGNSTFDSP
ncbi:MAG: helix-turn-helix domain-containing protein [Holophagales bacterium]|jgi:transcriptional regulator with XRE-family HTH domain|nr:helix-turn-helix domain-containing protein [Holophagales bacterium]